MYKITAVVLSLLSSCSRFDRNRNGSLCLQCPVSCVLYVHIKYSMCTYVPPAVSVAARVYCTVMRLYAAVSYIMEFYTAVGYGVPYYSTVIMFTDGILLIVTVLMRFIDWQGSTY